MDASKLFPTPWLKTEDVGKKSLRVRTESGDPVSKEKLGDKERYVLRLLGFDRFLILNSTRNDQMRELFGDQTETWGDQEIELYVGKAKNSMDTIMIRSPTQQETQPAEEKKEEPTQSQPIQAPQAGASPSVFDEAFGK